MLGLQRCTVVVVKQLFFVGLIFNSVSVRSMSNSKTYRRADGVIMGYDPFAPEMAEK